MTSFHFGGLLFYDLSDMNSSSKKCLWLNVYWGLFSNVNSWNSARQLSLPQCCQGLCWVTILESWSAASWNYICIRVFLRFICAVLFTACDLKCGHPREAHKLFDGLSQRDMVIWSALIAGYSRLGCVDEAKVLFYEMRNAGLEHNTVSWNGMITGFNHSGLYSKATSMFQKMHLEGFQPDSATISSVLSAIGDLKDFNMGIQVHSHVVKQGLGPDKCIVSALIDMYGKCSCTLEMSQVFNESDKMDVGAFNALVTGLSQNGLVDNLMEAFRRFKGQGLELNIVSWTSIIACCSQNGKDMDALELFREMQMEGMKPNSITIPCLLPACGNIAALMHGKAAHCFSIRIGISNDVYVGSALMIECMQNVVESNCPSFALKMPNRNLVSSLECHYEGYAMHVKG
ncbi:hypothetical protein FEM48_Zijuj07G0014300 [Ziziphus jujuba var. spinosa]|uniref:Pentatricopeptide repeat-containing protein n=1 Tax=Ziziphus jujuba var. spinosa TaxID=714518 RepID=A0A978V1M8_ZIZJJ|nr:hypothetical protein FEM48_Zijuj07G0014300 [Ziziphus jujuba var. spinosa]